MSSKTMPTLGQILVDSKLSAKKQSDIKVEEFAVALIKHDCTHLCLIAEDDYSEMPIDYYAIIFWCSNESCHNKDFIPIRSTLGYKILYKYLVLGSVVIEPEIWDGRLICQ